MATSKKGTQRKTQSKAVEGKPSVHERRNGSAAVTDEAEEHRRRVEQQAVMAEVQRADLLAIASHDLRNPLGVVLVTTTMLAREVTAPHQAEQLAAIRRAAMEMTQVIEDLVDGANIDTGGLDLCLEECAPTNLLAEAVAAAKAPASDRCVAVEMLMHDDLPFIEADRHRLLQVFSRLVSNALRFMPKNGVITIEAAKRGNDVRFAVTDSGPAIPDSQRPFAFLRRPPPGRRVCRGTGLGMFVVKGIVEAHGGRIELMSDPDRGNRVMFTLPTRRDA